MKYTRRRIWMIYVGVCFAVLLFLVWAKWYFRERGNFTEIEDGLYIGGQVKHPPPGTDAVLNLALSKDAYRVDIHLWEPIRDAAPAPSIAWLRKMVDWIDCKRRHGRTTFVHCRQGVSRSGLVVVAYVMHKKKWPRDRALEYVRSKRDVVRPNPAFTDRLLEWEGDVLKNRENGNNH